MCDKSENVNRWQASIPADKISIFSPASLTNLSLKLQFCMKKAAMKLSSLPLKMSVSYRNRTYNRVLGVDPIRWNQVQHSARKSLEIQGFSQFQILSGITLHKHFHRDFTPSNWLEISKAFDFRWTLQVQANSSM